jgi:cyclopropane fatty-acyl-phospholipid synthase-like methyltransferase
MSTDLDRVRAYYSRFGEWERLDSPSGALEFRRACALLNAHLPAGARVLDLGGGPGRYSIEFARRGHRVVLADLSATLLESARGKLAAAGVTDNIESIDEVDARNLGRYPERRFDAVVAFGPFYHLLSEQERGSAAREIWRVLCPGGLTFVSFIPRLSGLAGLVERAANNPEQVPVGALIRAASTGVFRNGSDSGFQEGYYPTPLELRELFEATGFNVLELVSLRSVANLLEPALARIKEPVRSEMEQVLEEVARNPAVVATGGHAVLVARKAP